MKGLILKDFYNVFRQWKFWGIYFVGMSLISVFSESFSMTGILMFVMPMIAMGAFSYDELTKWDRYALAMPVSRKKIVLARYLLCGIMIGVSLIFGIIVNVLSSIVHGNGPFNVESMLTVYGITVFVLIYVSLQLAIMYKLGPEKARIWTILLMMLPVVGFIVAVGALNSSETDIYVRGILNNLPWHIIGIAVGIIAVLSVFLSYHISVKIYSKKEF